MKLSSVVYQTVIRLYKLLPFKKEICLLLRAINFPKKFHKDLLFNSPFKVPVENSFFKISQLTTIENDIFWNGLAIYESETLWLWIILCKQVKVVFDVGANTGLYSLLAKTLNPTCNIYAFEPVKRTYELFQKNLKSNRFNIAVEMIALSNTDGEQTFYDTDLPDQQSASLSPNKLKNFNSYIGNIVEYKVQTIKLDSYIIEKNISRIDLMKIDVELHEPEVMEGFKEQIFHLMPDIIIEVLTQNVADQLNVFLKDSNYLIYHLSDKETMVLCDKISPVEHKWNFFLCKKETAQKLQQFIRT